MREFEILRHSANRKMIKIAGLEIRHAPKHEGGGYYLTGSVAEDIVSVLQAYDIQKLRKELDALKPLMDNAQ